MIGECLACRDDEKHLFYFMRLVNSTTKAMRKGSGSKLNHVASLAKNYRYITTTVFHSLYGPFLHLVTRGILEAKYFCKKSFYLF